MTTHETNKMEEERIAIIRNEQRVLSKKLGNSPRVKKRGQFLPGEENFKKRFAIILKLSGLSHNKIGAQIGETRGTVKGWFQEPAVKEEYEFMISHLTNTAVELLRTYQLEAITTLATLMRFGSEKMMFDSANAILDRSGIPRLRKEETSSEQKTVHTWDDDSMAKQMRNITDEDKREEFAAAFEKLEGLLAESVEEQNKNGHP